MTRLTRLAMPLALAATLATGLQASALEPLGGNSHITDRLVAARVADRIRRTCPDIGARILYAFSQAFALRDWAAGQGYSKSEIDAFLKDGDEKRKIYARAEDYLAANGAVPGDVAGFCALGRKEIATKTIVGSLIHEK